MSKKERCTCKNTVFHCQIRKFVTFVLLSSSWLLKLRGTEESSLEVASSVPLTHHDPKDLGLMSSKETQNPFSDSFRF